MSTLQHFDVDAPAETMSSRELARALCRASTRTARAQRSAGEASARVQDTLASIGWETATAASYEGAALRFEQDGEEAEASYARAAAAFASTQVTRMRLEPHMVDHTVAQCELEVALATEADLRDRLAVATTASV